jgi:hypothetical protein
MNYLKYHKYHSFILFLSILLTFSCGQSLKTNTKKQTITGKYTTHLLDRKEKVRFIIKHGNKFNNATLAVIELRDDSTYRMGFCDRKTAFSGKWRVENDSIMFYETMNHKSNTNHRNFSYYFNIDLGYILLPLTIKGGDSFLTVLKLGGEQFDGVFNEDETTKR